MLKTFFIQGNNGDKKKRALIKALIKTGEMLMFDIKLTNFNKIFYSSIGGQNSTLVLSIYVIRKRCEEIIDLPKPRHLLSTGNMRNI